MTANESHFSDIKLEVFDPELYHSCWTMRSTSDRASITEEELQKLCVQCLHCKNVVLWMSHALHKCPEGSADPTLCAVLGHATDNSSIFKKVEYHLDTTEKGHLLHGLMMEEFEGYYSKCMSCDCFLTEYRCDHHVCRESVMLQSLADSDGSDDNNE